MLPLGLLSGLLPGQFNKDCRAIACLPRSMGLDLISLRIVLYHLTSLELLLIYTGASKMRIKLVLVIKGASVPRTVNPTTFRNTTSHLYVNIILIAK